MKYIPITISLLLFAFAAHAGSWCKDHSMPVIYSHSTKGWVSYVQAQSLELPITSNNGLLTLSISNSSYTKVINSSGTAWNNYRLADVNKQSYFVLPLDWKWTDAATAIAIKGAAESRTISIWACEYSYGSSNSSGNYPGKFVIDRIFVQP